MEGGEGLAVKTPESGNSILLGTGASPSETAYWISSRDIEFAHFCG